MHRIAQNLFCHLELFRAKYILTDNNQIDYLISWDLPEMEIEQIRFYFSFIYKNNKLAIWKKLSPLPAPSQKVEQPYGAL